MASAHRSAEAAVAAHARTKDAAMDADRQAVADALRAGSPAPDDEHLPAWEAEHARLTREAAGYRDALADSYAELIRAVTDQAEDLRTAYATMPMRPHRPRRGSRRGRRGRPPHRHRRYGRPVVDQVEEHGTDASRIRTVTAPGLLRDGHQVLGAADLLAILRDYRAPRPPAPPAPSFEDVFRPGRQAPRSVRRAPGGHPGRWH